VGFLVSVEFARGVIYSFYVIDCLLKKVAYLLVNCD